MSYPAAPPAGYRTPLYARAPRATRTFLNISAIVLVLWIIGALPVLFHAPAVYFAGWGVALVWMAGYALPTAARTAVWLDGPALVVRSAYTTRRFDLSTCPVQISTDQKTMLPVLNVRDAAGRRASVLLREPKDKVLISPQKLHALAAAVLAGGSREPAGAQAAGQLAWLADNWPGNRSPQLR